MNYLFLSTKYKSMKIGFDAKRYFFNATGLGNYSRNIVGYLLKNYPNNEYFLFSPQKNKRLQVPDFQSIRVIKPRVALNSLWRSFGIQFNSFYKKLDIYHGLSNELPFEINKKVKTVLTVHDLIFMTMPHLYKPIDRKIYTLKMKKSCVRADVIIAISRQTKSDIVNLLSISEDKIKIVHQGCNEIFAKKILSERKKSILKKYNLPSQYILNVGTIEPRKNIFSVVKAIHTASIDFPLVIVGRQTEYQTEIENYVALHNLKNIHIINNVSFEDLPAIYQSAKIFVYPSVYEGFGIPLLEAFNSGVPVIVSNIDVFNEVAEDAALFIDPKSIENIAEKIMFLLENDDIRQEYINKGFHRINNFTGKKIADDLFSIYKTLL